MDPTKDQQPATSDATPAPVADVHEALDQKLPASLFAATPHVEEDAPVAELPVPPPAPPAATATSSSSSATAPARTIEVFDPRTKEITIMPAEHHDEAPADTLRTVEEWRAIKKTKRWDFDLARGHNAWAVGKELTEADYDAAVDAAGKVLFS